VEIALKMSFHYWRNNGQPEKNQFVCVAGSYHGETLGTLSVGDVALYKDAYAPLLRQATAVPSPDARRPLRRGKLQPMLPRGPRLRWTAIWPSTTTVIAAFIVEPLVQGAGGMVMHDPHYLRLARESVRPLRRAFHLR
jgi:adenosylmethionine-8-amino-7-oxononanoate aminotransferase